MAKHGWEDMSGLGPDGKGITRPIDAHSSLQNVQHGKSHGGLGDKSDAKGKGKVPEHVGLDGKTEGPASQLAKVTMPTSGMNHGPAAPKDANTEIIDQDNWVIHDTWKNKSVYMEGQSGLAQSPMRKTAEVPSPYASLLANVHDKPHDRSHTRQGSGDKWCRKSKGAASPAVAVTENPPPPLGWVYDKMGDLKPNLKPRFTGDPESYLTREEMWSQQQSQISSHGW
jgi:hypothetical protein